MNVWIALIGTTVTFLVIDAVWIGLVVRNLYDREVGHLLAESPGYAAAAVFYLLYAAGIVYLAVWPALQSGQATTALLNGAVLGALAYGTFAITNYAVLKGWPLNLVVADILWGTVLTAVSAWAGYAAARVMA